jgi:hypothetical protein
MVRMAVSFAHLVFEGTRVINRFAVEGASVSFTFLARFRARDRRGAQQPRSGRSERGVPQSPVGHGRIRDRFL